MKIDRKINLTELVTAFEKNKGSSAMNRVLSKIITVVENDSLLTANIIERLQKGQTPASQVIGITGLPGSGKSTLISALIKEYRKKNHTVALFAIDPSSQNDGGAILGDRIRMQEHFHDEGVFIRSMGTRGELGGVNRAVQNAVFIAKQAGFSKIIIETVGVGQSESRITNIADTSVLLMVPDSGDEIQWMKSGILELADIYVINKSDLKNSNKILSELLENNPVQASGWKTQGIKTSAIKEEGISELAQKCDDHLSFLSSMPQNSDWKKRRLLNLFINEVVAVSASVYEKMIRENPEKIKFLEKHSDAFLLPLAKKFIEQNEDDFFSILKETKKET